jgi:hypothetical protein
MALAKTKPSSISIAHYDVKHVDFKHGRMQATIRVAGAHKTVLDTVNLYNKPQRVAFISEVSMVLGQPKAKTEAEVFLLISSIENREATAYVPESDAMAKPVRLALTNPKLIEVLCEQLTVFNYPVIEDLFLAYLAVLSRKTRHPILISMAQDHPLFGILQECCPSEVDLSSTISIESSSGRLSFQDCVSEEGPFQDRTLDDFSRVFKRPEAIVFLHTLFRMIGPVMIVMDPKRCVIPDSLPKRLSVLYLQSLEVVALLRQFQKEVLTHEAIGNYFDVDDVDRDITDRIIVPILRRLTSDLSPSARRLLEQIRGHCILTQSLVFTRRDIREKYDWEPTALHRKLHVLCRLDYVRVKGLPNGYAHTYRLMDVTEDA